MSGLLFHLTSLAFEFAHVGGSRNISATLLKAGFLHSDVGLLHVKTLKLKVFISNDIPLYAILSHTWRDEDVSYQQIQEFNPLARFSSKQGYYKI